MRLAHLLRLTAIGIALLGFFDPPILVALRPPMPVTIAVARSPLDAAPADAGKDTTRREAVDAAVAVLVDALSPNEALKVQEFGDAERLPCGAPEACVVVATEPVRAQVPDDRTGHTSIVSVASTLEPNLAITAPGAIDAHAAAEGHVPITLEGRGLRGRSTRVQVFDGAAIVGEASHVWTADGPVEIDVPWWPVAPGTRALSMQATTDDLTEQATVDNQARLLADVGAERWPVLIHERRPSWTTAFVRRALEHDPRFGVDVRTMVAPAITAGTKTAGLLAAALDRSRVIIAGALDALTADDVTRLDAYVRMRGGTLVLTPDRAVSGPAVRLLAHRWTERLEPLPTAAGGLQASEWLVAGNTGALDQVWGSTEAGPTIVATPAGAGRIVVVGAMDAWRHRGNDGAFDRFWQRLIADAARRAGAPVDVTTMPRWVRPGERVALTVRGRRVEVSGRYRATAQLECNGGERTPIRLWPGNAPGMFEGTVRPAAGTCVVVAAIDGIGEGRTSVVTSEDAPAAGRTEPGAVRALVSRTGGLAVTSGELPEVVDALRAFERDTREPESRYPMRSAWWMLPLACCLAGEWWLRRRAGLR